MKSDFLVVCLNPTIQKTIILNELKENEVNRSSDYRTDASGKGVNVTRVLSQLGADSVHLTQSGYRADYFLNLTNEDYLNVQTVPNKSPIRTCTTLISNTNITVTEIVEESLPVDVNTETLILDEYKRLLINTENVIISGSKASGFSNNIFPQMVKLAKTAKKTVILDYRGKDLINSVSYRPDIIKINFPEFVSTFFPDYSIGEHEENIKLKELVIEKITELYSTFGIKTILTRGTMPVIFMTETGSILEEKIRLVKPINTIGSGDAFTAGLAFKLNQKASLKEAVLFGAECGSKNAGLLRPGVIR
ncbi:MAG: PfkB family carbohydrate kinase [Spirochaetia bacterium]|jgi:fructose-1-phosphate kinase PfkB-like protein|nr:PfkB family carbohydrate kinase [Spirochaetia bacterium]